MLNATAVAPVRATKAPTRAKASPAPTAPEAIAGNDDEAFAAATLAQQLQAIYDTCWQDLGVYPSSLVLMAIKVLENVHNCSEEVDRGEVFHNAAAAVSGALAVVKAKQPDAPFVGKLEATFQTLQSADISYGFNQEPCEALANGIRAGQRQFRDRPQPPIRRMQETELQSKGYSHAQLKSALEFVAGAADSVRNVLLLAQTVDERWEARQLVEAAELMVRHIGASADIAGGQEVIGDLERWNYGPNFHRAGGAA